MDWLGIISGILSYFPVIGLAALGELISQKAGVYNIGIEGIVAFGTFSGILGYYLTGSLWLSLLIGFVLASIFGVLLSVLSVSLNFDQIVIGFGLWFLAEGLAGFLYAIAVPGEFNVPERFGEVIFNLNPLIFITIGLFVFFFVLLRWTKEGLAIRVVGERPEVADTAGINVSKVRWICCIVGAGLMGLAGAYLAVHVLQGFTYKMVAGYGWIAFAITLFGRWSPGGILFGSVFFSSLIGIQTRLQVAKILFIPKEFMVVLPHIGVVVLLAILGIWGRKTGMPAALGKPYERE